MRYSIRPKTKSNRSRNSAGSGRSRSLSRSLRSSMPFLTVLVLMTIVASAFLVVSWAKKGTPDGDLTSKIEMTQVNLKSKGPQIGKDGLPMAEEARQPEEIQATANAVNYTFLQATDGSLADMSTGTTQLLAANVDDTASPLTNIGFDFYFMGVRYSQFSINENGVFRLGATAQTGSPYKPLGQTSLPIITAYGADQRTHAGDGKVHFKVFGSAPNRKLVVEWLNNQADFNSGGTANVTYQVQVTETTGVIEFVYGSMAMSTLGAADTNSQNPNIGFSSSNTTGTIGTVTAAQSGTPSPSYNGSTATPVANLYTAGTITVLNSAAQGSRQHFTFTPPVPTAPTGLNFTSVTPTAMTLNWTDAPTEVAYAIYNSTDGTNFTFVGSAASDATSFNATNLSPSTNYTWRLYAVSEGAQSTALSGVQASGAPGNVVCNGAGGLWSSTGTWVGGVVPQNGDNVTIGNGCTVTIDTAAAAFGVTVQSGGVLQYETTTARTLTVQTNVTVDAGGTLQTQGTGTVTTHTLSLAGNLVNNGTLDFSTNADTAGAGITFTGLTNTSFSGTGATTDVRTITVNKGTNNTAIMELMPSNFTVRGVTTDTVVGGWLVMTNGTIKVSGTFSGTSRVFSAAAYTIPATFGFWLNNPNYTVAAQAGNAVNNGLWRISQGTFNQGTLASHSFRSGAGAVFTIEGGTVNCAGQFSPQNAVTYNQSAGTLNVGLVGNSQSNFGTFELFSSTAAFNMSGGTINIVQASTGATQIDYQNLAVSTITGGTVNVGTAATVTKFTFNIRGNLPNLVIDNTTNNKFATATAQVNLRGNTTINPGTSLTINGQICLVIGPTFTNNGTLIGTAASTRFYFLGLGNATTYNGSGTATAPMNQFEVDNPLGVTLDPAINPIVTGRFNNFSGGLTGSGKLTVGNGGATTAVVQLGVAGVTQTVNGFDVPPVFNPGTGGVNLLYAPELTGRTTGNEMPPSRTLNLLSITNTNPITIAGGDVQVNGASAGALALGAARVITGTNTLYFNSAAGTVTRTTGLVDGNFKKSYSAVGSKTFEVGTANGYSPVTVNVTAGTFPADFTVKAVQTAHPAFGTPSKATTRYWTLTEGGDVTADLTFNYLDPTDIPGTVTEANLLLYKYNGAFSQQMATVDTTANTAVITGVSDFSDWTLAETGALAVPGTLAFSSPTYSNSEEGPTATIAVNRTGGSDGAVTVDYSFPAGGTATGAAACGAGVDYVNTGGTLNFGDTVTTQNITVQLCGDTTDEPDETVNLLLSNATGGATIGGQSTAVLTLTDDDVAFVGPVTVTATAGTPGPTDYGTVKAAFDAINAGTHQGAITIWIVSNTTEGTTPATLNSSGAGSASYTSVNMYPINDGLTITGNPATGFGVIQLKGADNVTIDGDNPNTAGTNRNLTINNTNTATAIAGSVIRVATAATVVTSADNITLKNMNLNGNVTGGNLSSITSNTGSSNSSFGIYAGGNGGATATDAPTAITSVTTNTAPTGTTINNFTVDNNAINQTARGVVFNGASAGVSTGIAVTNNLIGGTGTLTGNAPFTSPSTTVYSKGIWVAGTTAYNISGNTIRNILSYILTTPIQAIEINTATGTGTMTISNNTITGVAQNSATATAARGIVVSQAGGPYTISGNTVSNVQGVLTGTAAATVAVGIEVSTSATSATISGNKVSKIYNLNPGTTGVRGINIAAGSNVTIQNNFVSDVLHTMTGGIAFDGNFSPIGIRIAAGTGHKVYHNSVNLSGTPFGTANSSILSAAFAITATTLTGIDARDNIFSNTMTGGTTSVAHVSMFLPTNTTSAMNLTLNNNDYNSGPSATTQGIAQAGTTAGTGFYLASNFNAGATTPATNLRALTTLLGPATNDDSSKVVDPLFFTSSDLHITGVSPMIDAGVSVGVTTDIDGQARPNGAAVDIGADEYYPAAGALQLSAPAYTGNEGGTVTITVTRSGGDAGAVGATLTLADGSATGGAACGAGVDYVNPGPQPVNFATNVTSVPVNVQLCTDGAVNDPNETFTATLSAPTGGATLGSPAAATVTIVDIPPAFGGTYTVGSGGNYPSLTNPGGIFEAINLAGATGNVVINITSDLTGESGSVALNQVTGGFSVTIKPSGAPRTITSTAAAVSVIKLNEADNVTIDGSTSGGSDRSLSIINANPAANTACIWLAGSANGAQNNTIKNVNLQGGADQSTANVFNFGIISSSSAAILTGGTDNDNNTYTNNFIKKVSVGIAAIGGLATNMNQNTVISNNLIGPAAFGVDEVSTLGILFFNETGTQVTGNELRFIGDAATTGGSSGRDHVGISLCTGSASWSGSAAPTIVGTVTNANVSGNRIHDIVERATFSAAGIVENCTNAGNPTNNTFANNFIYNILANGTSPDQSVGIGIANGNGDKVLFNSINMAGDVDPAGATSSDTSSFGISLNTTTSTNLTIKNNISVMNLTSNTGTLLHSAINIPASYAWGTGGSNNNDWYPVAANPQARVGTVGGSAGTFHATLAAWQTATTQDAASISADPTFVSGTDLHVQAGSPVLAMAAAGTGITTDIDGETRDAVPDIGADEIVNLAVDADLSITKTDGVMTVTAGGSTTYTITASNAGPSAATGANVTDMFPAAITGVNWTCVGAGGGTCTASGMGNINDTVNLPAGGSVTYTATAQIAAAATGSLANTATVSVPGGVNDPNGMNNSFTDTDTITLSADLSITKTDGVSTASPGGSVTYTITASNAGPSNVSGATVADMLPAAIASASWSCSGNNGGTCTASGMGSINDVVNLPAGGSVTYVVNATVSGAASGSLVNTATVTEPGGVTDSNQMNNSQTDTDTITPLPTMTISDARLTEGNAGNTNMTFTVTLNGGGAASVHYHTVDGTAQADALPPVADPEVAHGNDYVPEQNGIVSFGTQPNPEGGSQTRTFNIIIHGDTFKEPNEYFSVVLDQVSGAQLSDDTGYGVIVDDERAYVSDIDHDRKTDISVFRPSDRNWYTLGSFTGNPIYQNFGLSTDRPVPGDYDGDGGTDYAVRRPGAQNVWWVQFSGDVSLHSFIWGVDTDLSVQADYDGDDKTDVAVFRDGAWLILLSSTNTSRTVFFGQAGDIPVVGDFDGDGKADFTVFRAGTWYTQRSSDSAVVTQAWGTASDKPVGGDFDGDGRFDYAVFRNGTWYVLRSLNGDLQTEFWGQAGDIPVVGDYDGDGTSDVAVFRPANGVWYILRSSNRTILGVAWGLTGDIPIPAAYQP